MSKYFKQRNQANETIDKYKLLSAYGGSGSIIHTQYGSIIISCIEEWGFLNKIIQIRDEKNEREYVLEQAQLERNGNIGISNDFRLLESLKDRKELVNLEYLVLVPNIELDDFSNKVKDEKTDLTIPSTYIPKIFTDRESTYKHYNVWYKQWVNETGDVHAEKFFPPKKMNEEKSEELVQDNIVLICEHGHISDFPWSQYLNWKSNGGIAKMNEAVDLFNREPCCGTIQNPTSIIQIQSSTANASGFDGKWLKCGNCKKQTSLSGLMGVKIKCGGHKPWEVTTGDNRYYSGDNMTRQQLPPLESCKANNGMKVALTTGNNLYYSRTLSSIYMPNELFKNPLTLQIEELELDKEEAVAANDFVKAGAVQKQIEELKSSIPTLEFEEELTDSEKEVLFRYEEFKALSKKDESDINIHPNYLKVKNVTNNLKDVNRKYFSKILRIDQLKITSAQLDFSRVVPVDADASDIVSKNIFKSKAEEIIVYPVVESYGEGIFFAFDKELMESYATDSTIIETLNNGLDTIYQKHDDFSKQAIEYGQTHNWQLYLIHTFSHLIMKELEFRCGYPTASLSERIYVSNDEGLQMYGCMIYTAEGAEGSMGGLIAQTNTVNLNNLIKSALYRATICNSDPLCWESEGQGLFDLNFASCFSCSLVSETSCELRNIYLDRKILVDEELGFFREVVS